MKKGGHFVEFFSGTSMDSLTFWLPGIPMLDPFPSSEADRWPSSEKLMEESWKMDEFDGRLMGNGRNFRGHLWEIYGNILGDWEKTWKTDGNFCGIGISFGMIVE